MNRTNSTEVRYGTPGTGKAAADRASAGRRCEVASCETVLSTYNAATTCWLHSSAVPKHSLAPR
jgi:hypothetical protein